MHPGGAVGDAQEDAEHRWPAAAPPTARRPWPMIAPPGPRRWASPVGLRVGPRRHHRQPPEPAGRHPLLRVISQGWLDHRIKALPIGCLGRGGRRTQRAGARSRLPRWSAAPPLATASGPVAAARCRHRGGSLSGLDRSPSRRFSGPTDLLPARYTRGSAVGSPKAGLREVHGLEWDPAARASWSARSCLSRCWLCRLIRVIRRSMSRAGMGRLK